MLSSDHGRLGGRRRATGRLLALAVTVALERRAPDQPVRLRGERRDRPEDVLVELRGVCVDPDLDLSLASVRDVHL